MTREWGSCLGCIEDDVDVRPEVDAIVLHDAQQEPMTKAQRRAWLHGGQHARVQLRLCRAVVVLGLKHQG